MNEWMCWPNVITYGFDMECIRWYNLAKHLHSWKMKWHKLWNEGNVYERQWVNGWMLKLAYVYSNADIERQIVSEFKLRWREWLFVSCSGLYTCVDEDSDTNQCMHIVIWWCRCDGI